jgi:hypothetical protein
METSRRGFNLLELAVVMAISMTILGLAIPAVLGWSSQLRLKLGAQEIVGAMRSARHLAAQKGTKVGVKFLPAEKGASISYALFADGDGDGVRSRDIDTGVDPQVAPPRLLAHLGRHVHFGFPPGPPPRDPGNPRKRVTRLHDPIRFNRSDIASFGPLGGSTPGSIYLTDSRRGLVVVRVFGFTGKVKTMTYDCDEESWR